MTRNELSGTCKACNYADVCLGGCPNTRLTMNGSMKSENPYCAFKIATDKLSIKVKDYPNQEDLFPKAVEYAKGGNLQEASVILEHLLSKKPNDEDVLALMGYVNFFIGNYDRAKEANETILKEKPTHSYANKGMGLTLYKMGQVNEGIKYMEESIKYAPDGFLDPYYDLATIYRELGENKKAEEIISLAKTKQGIFS